MGAGVITGGAGRSTTRARSALANLPRELRHLQGRDKGLWQEVLQGINAAERPQELHHCGKGGVLPRFRALSGAVAHPGLPGDLLEGSVLLEPVGSQSSADFEEHLAGGERGVIRGMVAVLGLEAVYGIITQY